MSDFGFSKEKLNNWMNEKPKVRRGQEVYWMTTTQDGKMVVLGYRLTADECESFLAQNQIVDYQIVPLRTISTDAAVRALKGKRLNETGNLDIALQRFGRKL